MKNSFFLSNKLLFNYYFYPCAVLLPYSFNGNITYEYNASTKFKHLVIRIYLQYFILVIFCSFSYGVFLSHLPFKQFCFFFFYSIFLLLPSVFPSKETSEERKKNDSSIALSLYISKSRSRKV